MAEIARILEQISQDAKQEEENILNQAQKQVREILEKAETEADTACAEILEKAQKMTEEAKKRTESAVATEQKKALLLQKRRLLEDAFRNAALKLQELSQDEFMAYLERKLFETSLKGEGKLIVPAKYKVGLLNLISINAKLKGLKVSVSEEDRGLQSGFILVCGLVEENYTFEAQILALKDELTAPVAEILLAE